MSRSLHLFETENRTQNREQSQYEFSNIVNMDDETGTFSRAKSVQNLVQSVWNVPNTTKGIPIRSYVLYVIRVSESMDDETGTFSRAHAVDKQ